MWVGGGTGELVGWTGRLVVGGLGLVEVRPSAVYLVASGELRAVVESGVRLRSRGRGCGVAGELRCALA